MLMKHVFIKGGFDEDLKSHIQLRQDLFKCWIHGNEVGDVHRASHDSQFHQRPTRWGIQTVFFGLMIYGQIFGSVLV